MDLNQISLESVLIIIIVLITLNLLFIGFYIINVLRELRKTVVKARLIMDDVDRSVKDGIEKVISIEKPLQALTATTNALTGFIKGADIIKKATQSILGSNSNENNIVEKPFIPEEDFNSTSDSHKKNGLENDSEKNPEFVEKKSILKPRFFRSSKKN